MSMDYTVVYEKSKTGWNAYLPDLPGCVAADRTLPGVKKRIRAAVSMHIAGMVEDGLPLPQPKSLAELVHVEAA